MKLLSSPQILLKNTPETYYWMGFFMADATFIQNRLKIHLAKRDIGHIKKIKKYLKYTGKNKKPAFSVVDHITIPLLRQKFDIKPQKTYNPPNLKKIFKNTSPKLIFSFIVGYIDGDGSIYRGTDNKNKTYLALKGHKTSFKNFCYMVNFLQTFLKIKTPTPFINSQGYADFKCGKNESLIAIKRKVLSLSLPVLKRKWSKINLNRTTQYMIGIKNKQNIDKLKQANLTNSQIAKKLKISKSTVTKHTKRM